MPLIAKVMYSTPSRYIFSTLHKERCDLASIALHLEINGPVLLGS